MSSAPRDENRVPGLIAESNDSNRTPVTLYADPLTHRLLVNTTLTGSTLPVAGATTGLGVAILDGSGNQVTSFGGGTQYAEDAAHASGDIGTLSLAIRNDAQIAKTSANNDYSGIAVDDVGRPIVASAAYSTRIDAASATVTYLGNALTGTATSAASWQVKKIDSSSGTSITFADGDPKFDNVWDDRATLTYS